MASRIRTIEMVLLARDLASSVFQTVSEKVRGLRSDESDAAEANRELEKSFDDTEKKTNKFSDAIKNARNSLAGYAASIFGLNLLKKGFVSIIEAGADLETLELQIKQLYDTAEEGTAAFDWVQQFAKQNPTFDVTKAFVKLKVFGVDPVTGALQSLVDQTSKLGGDQQVLEGLILAVGQAWSKQKLQGEEILQLVERGVPVWDLLAKRLRQNAHYVRLFKAAFPQIIYDANDITLVAAANAIAAFEAVTFRSDNSPFDRYLRGDTAALSEAAKQGMALFYGKAQCAQCHAGVLQTDHQFYAIGIPQIGPGKGDGPDGRDDFGRERVTGKSVDRYRFRTPSLRNVALTGPWGHDGAYAELQAVVRHHIKPNQALNRYQTQQALLPSRDDLDAIDFIAHGDPARRQALRRAIELPKAHLTEPEIEALLSFLQALTGPKVANLRNQIPMHVPSGLPVFD